MHNIGSNYMRGFGSLLTKYYLSSGVQWVTDKQGGKLPHSFIPEDRYRTFYRITIV